MNIEPPLYKIERYGSLIFVVLKGTWTVQSDLAYITALDNTIFEMKRKQWAMFVDMTQWTLPLEVFQSQFKSKILLDRRSQIAESWFVKQPNQGELLLPFFKEAKFSLLRTTALNAAIEHIDGAGIDAKTLRAYYNV